jgi:hypothetical protein
MWLRSLAALGFVTLLLAGCGGGSNRSSSTGAGGTALGTGTATGSAGGASASAGSTGASGPSNGVASKPATQIVAAASRAIETAHSVHVVGSIVDNGIEVHLDLHLSRGHGGQGRVSENGLGFRLISTGRLLYIQGSSAFWAHFGGARAAKVFHGKWLKAPDAGQFGTLGHLATTRGLVAELLSRHGKLSRAGRTTVGGHPAVGLVDRTQGGTLFVSTTGPPYPLEIVKHGANGGYVRFTDFNQPVTITPPAKSISLPG